MLFQCFCVLVEDSEGGVLVLTRKLIYFFHLNLVYITIISEVKIAARATRIKNPPSQMTTLTHCSFSLSGVSGKPKIKRRRDKCSRLESQLLLCLIQAQISALSLI